MKLYQRKESTFWWVHFTVDGQPVRKSTKRRNKKEAERVAAGWYAEAHDRSQLGIKPEATLEEACQRYIDTMVTSSSHYNLGLYRDKLLGVGKWSGKVFNLSATMKMSALKTHHIAQLRERRKAEGLANNTVNLELRFIQRVYNLARKEWGYAVNPDVGFKSLKVKPKTRYLSKEEEVGVLDYLDRPTPAYQRAFTLGTLLVDTGMRLGEALNLRWSQIERESRMIRVYRQKTRSWSTVPLTGQTEAALEQFSGQIQPFIMMNRAIKLLRRAINEVCNTDEYITNSSGRATIHSLRDTYATRLVTRGMSLYKVSKLLGHSNVTQSAKYSDLEIETVADEALSILESA